MILTKEQGKHFIATNLDRLMKERSITQQALADAVKMSQSMISKILNAKVCADSIDIRNIAEVLGVSQDEITSNEPKRKFRKTG